MPKVTFIAADGVSKTVEAPAGTSVMQAAISHGVNGIVADCGGAMACATCHVFVESDWFDRVGAPSGDEADMLAGAATAPEATSRLSCQISLTDDLDGLQLRIPARQF